MKVTVVGLGKIGLPLAVQYASKGATVFGADANPAVVDLVNAGQEPFPGECELAERLASAVKTGNLTATTDTTEAVSNSDVVVVVVPLFVDNDGIPDFGWMDSATKDIGRGLRQGTLVIYETTLPVGTTRTRFAPKLQELSGLVPGEGFFMAFSPERVLTGRVFADLRRYPKLVGGINQSSADQSIEFYNEVLDFDDRPDLNRANGVWDLGSAEAAELAKLAETTYRDVNIGLANQFAVFGAKHGIDVHAVIEASNSQPYSHIHSPGIAVGGHCIPVYPRLYLWNDSEATVVRAAREANAAMPEYTVGLLEENFGDLSGARVVVLGAAYRGGVKETAFSGVFATVDALKRRNAEVLVHDPMYSDDELTRLGFTPFHLGDSVDAAVVQADHVEYTSLSSQDLAGLKTIVDGRRITRSENFGTVRHVVLGQPS